MDGGGPVRVHACKDVEVEVLIPRFGWDVSDMFDKVW